jgi:hypothetical protein
VFVKNELLQETTEAEFYDYAKKKGVSIPKEKVITVV